MNFPLAKRRLLKVLLLAVLMVGAVALGAAPAFADHESTHLRCPNDPTRFTPNCAGDPQPQTTGTVTGTTLPRTAGADGELSIIALALIGIGMVLQRRWVLARRAV